MVPKGDKTCPKCGAEYWQPKEIALRSLLFPSWGDFLMRHYLLATLELIGYLISWIFIGAIVVAGAFSGDPEDLAIGLVILGIFLVFTHIPDAILTYYIASKGLNRRRPPDEGKIQDIDDLEPVESDAEGDFAE